LYSPLKFRFFSVNAINLASKRSFHNPECADRIDGNHIAVVAWCIQRMLFCIRHFRRAISIGKLQGIVFRRLDKCCLAIHFFIFYLFIWIYIIKKTWLWRHESFWFLSF
jgi:hypothetical protein